MKRNLLTLILALPTMLFGQTAKSGDATIDIKFYTPDIVRVTKTPANSVNTQPNLVVTLSPQEVNVKKTSSGGTTT